MAVITVVGLLDVLMVSNSVELRSFSLTVCILAPESTTNSLSSGSLAEALGRTHFSPGAALSIALSLYIFWARSQALLWAHRSCFSVSSWDRSSNFYSAGTSLMSRWDLYFSTNGAFLSRILAWAWTWWIELFELRSRLSASGFPETLFVPWEASASDSCDIQPNCDTLFTVATAPLSSLSLLFGKLPFFGLLFGCSSTLYCGNRHVSPDLQPGYFFIELGIVAETATVSLWTLAFFFQLVTDTFSSFNANDSLSTLHHGSRFSSPMRGVKVS